MEILGISGKRESGKSLLAKFLGEYGYKRVSLADPLKGMCQNLYGLTEEQVRGSEKESPTKYKRTDGSFYTPRDILIREGCLKRSIDPDFWCQKLFNLTQHMYYMGEDMKFVIDDIRFLNEIAYFRKLGAKFIRLERSQEAIGKAALDDLSETELDQYSLWDYHLIEELNRIPDDLKKFAEYIACESRMPWNG